MKAVIRILSTMAHRRSCAAMANRASWFGVGPGTASALLLATLLLAGCQSLESTPSNAAQLRVIAASPDAPGLDFYAGRGALAYGVEFGAASSYVPLPAGNDIRIAARTANSSQTLVSSRTGLLAGRQYTAIVSNVAASLEESVYLDQTQPAPGGQIELRVIDAATRAGAVDLYLVPEDGHISTTAPLKSGLVFGASTGYILQTPGVYSLMVMPVGAESTSSTQTLLTGPQAIYAPGAVRTIVLVDRPRPEQGIDEIVAEDYDPS